jgi:hypothetical protein
MKFRYACEFPEKVNWNKLNNWLEELNLNPKIYLACKSKKDFLNWKKKINSKRISLIAWPILPKNKGYWFSGHTKKKNIDLLDEFKNIPLIIDLEPPFSNNKFNRIKEFFGISSYFLKKAPNKKYLQEKIKKLNKTTKVTISSFPLPKFLLKNYGWCQTKKQNYMFYSVFLPKFLRPIYRFFFRFFIKLNKNALYTIGPTGPGIYGNEPHYKNIQEMKTDINYFKKQGVKELIIFELSSINKSWLKTTKS